MKVLHIDEMSHKTLITYFDALHDKIKGLEKKFTPKEPTKYMTRREVADLFGVSLVTVSEWTKKGILKSYKIANRVYYKRHEIDQSLTEVKTAKA